MAKRPTIDFEELARRPGARVIGINLTALGGAISPGPPKPAPPTPEPARASKYNAKRTEYNGLWFDSAAEAKRAEQLDLLFRAGEVDWWLPQVKVRLGVPECSYRVDFLVCERGQVHAEDVKGVETAAFRKNRHLWQSYGPMPLRVIKDGQVAEVIPPGTRRHEIGGSFVAQPG